MLNILPLFRRCLLPVLGVGGAGLAGCTDPYLPDAIATPPSYLVVDGFLNSQGVSTIVLSRTAALAAKTAPPVETKATVYIEDKVGTRLLLAESSVKGTYTSAALTLNPARTYRLHLNTLAGKEYVSEFVPVKNTPPIDAVTWRPTSEGLQRVRQRPRCHQPTPNTTAGKPTKPGK